MQNWKFQHRYFSCLNISKNFFEMGFHCVALERPVYTMKFLSVNAGRCVHTSHGQIT